MISSPIFTNPTFVVPTPTCSNVENSDASWTDILAVDPTSYAAVNFVGLTSDCASEIITWLVSKYIPWFLWSTLICKPSVSVVTLSSWTPPPFAKFNSVVIPALLSNVIV